MANKPNTSYKPTNRPGRLSWILAGASLLLMAVACLLLYYYNFHGDQDQVWPVYAFAAVMLVCGLVLASVVGRFISSLK